MLPIILAIRDENDRDFVAEIFDVYEKKLYLKAFNILHNREDSEDCLQDVIVAVVDHLEKIKTMSAKRQKCYIETICRNRAIDMYNKKKQKWEYESSLYTKDDKIIDIIDEKAFVDELLVNDENVERLFKITEDLDDVSKDIVYFKHWLQLSNAEIAKSLGITINNLNVRYHRVRNKLRERWYELYDEKR